MYASLYLLYTLIAIFIVMLYFRRWQIVIKVCSMTEDEKILRLNDALRPFGLSWRKEQGILADDASQLRWPAKAAKDSASLKPICKSACDIESIVFEYKGTSCLTTLWKGQWGISAGAGMYSSAKALNLSYDLIYGRDILFTKYASSSFQSGYLMGSPIHGNQLIMAARISFPEYPMLEAFVHRMHISGYGQEDLQIQELTVAFDFTAPRSLEPCIHRCFHSIHTRLNCCILRKFYLCITHTYPSQLDKLVYLQCYLPPVFRRVAIITNANRGYPI